MPRIKGRLTSQVPSLAMCPAAGPRTPARARRRMQDHQSAGVQGDASGKRQPAAILAIADNRMAVMGQLQPNLVFSAGLQLHLQPRGTAAPGCVTPGRAAPRRTPHSRGRLCHTSLDDRQPAVGEAGFSRPRQRRTDNVHSPMTLVMSQPIDQTVRRRFDQALDDGPIRLLYGVGAELLGQPSGGLRSAGQNTTPVTGASRRLITPK